MIAVNQQDLRQLVKRTVAKWKQAFFQGKGGKDGAVGNGTEGNRGLQVGQSCQLRRQVPATLCNFA